MTKKQKEAYLKNPEKCPYCGSTVISADPMEVDEKHAWREVECSNCQETWNDVYTLTDVEDVED